MNWIKGGKVITEEGTTIVYRGDDANLFIESRKRHIPHANGKAGTWDHTTYWLIDGDEDIKEFYSLKDAKDYAEKYRR